ncbi:MAG TPA: hypothetical protein VGE70_10130 [Burkholderiaceae bacterium]
MSQILDALKRAEAQRQGQPAAQAGAQPPAADPLAAPPPPSGAPRWGVILLVLAALVAALWAWYALGPSLTVTVQHMAPPASLSPTWA